MMKELLAIAIGAGMALLITLKSDQQSIIILKGKLFHSRESQNLAKQTYMKHARALDVVLAAAGLAMLTLAISLLASKAPFFYVPGVVGLVLAEVGIWGRCRTYLAADRELDALGKDRRGPRKGEKTRGSK